MRSHDTSTCRMSSNRAWQTSRGKINRSTRLFRDEILRLLTIRVRASVLRSLPHALMRFTARVMSPAPSKLSSHNIALQHDSMASVNAAAATSHPAHRTSTLFSSNSSAHETNCCLFRRPDLGLTSETFPSTALATMNILLVNFTRIARELFSCETQRRILPDLAPIAPAPVFANANDRLPCLPAVRHH